VPVFTPASNVIDGTLTNSASMNALALGNGYLEVDYAAGFPAGSEIGFVLDKGLLSLALLNNVTISTYSTASGATAVESRSADQLLGLGVGTSLEKVGFVTTAAFRRVRITFSGLDLTPLLSGLRIYYAEVFVPSAGPAPNCSTVTALTQSAYPAITTYGATGLTGTLNNSANIAGILNSIANPDNITNSTTTDFATITTNANVAGGTYLSVQLLQGSVASGHFAGFDIENASLLGLGVLNGLTVEVRNNGTVVQSRSGSDLLEASLLTSGNRQTIGILVTNGTEFDEVRLLISEGLLDANVGIINVYSAVVRGFCPPTAPLPDYVVLANGHPSTNGTGVAVNGENSGLVGANILGFSESLDNLIDSDPNNFVTINGSIVGAGVASSASLSVTTPAHTFSNNEYAGFIVRGGAGLIDVGALTGITISTYNNGVLVESATSGTLLNLNALGLALTAGMTTPDGVTIIGFPTTGAFDEVQLTVNGLGSVGNSLEVYRAFVSADAALPVDFGALSAVFQNGALLVNWSTLSENNNKEFVVEGSADGTTWVKLGTVASKAANGNSDTAIEYSFSKTLQELAVLSGFSLISVILLMGLVLMICPSLKRKTAFMLTPVLAIAMTFTLFSCSKSDKSYEVGDKPVAYIRIAQVDKDGTTSYSKVVKVVDK
ncbi:hypothetical protein, partial [Spirosoma sp.]|uniref:hypothetical protein n=1 Tax=Spirosoma sp. TaxID=1899569 RepID=UPI003B3B8314